MTKTVTKHQAGAHQVRVRDWGAPVQEGLPHRVDLTLDGFCLVVMDVEKRPLLDAIAEQLAFALRAPERKKK